ncbi:MAG: immunoglobulin domain-containing protein [Phycisphaeraceae bacterium]|nr:immunoglobulin domain-containing protein [Phycisphaeraceae bacterium]
MRQAVSVLLATLAAAGSVWAQPSIVSLGTSADFKLSTDGSRMASTVGGQAVRYNFSGGSMTIDSLGGQSGTGISGDGLIVGGNIQNLGINNGRPLTHTIAGRWVTGSWTDLPLFENPGVGSPNPPGTLSTHSDMSANGRYQVGLAYNAAAGNNARAFIYDAVTNTTTMLPALPPTPGEVGMSPARANGVSDDGTVVVGFDQMGARVPTVWTYDGGTATWTETILNTSVGELWGVSADGQWIFGTSGEFPLQGARWTRVGGVWTATALPEPAAPPAGLPAGYTLSRITPYASNADGSVIVGAVLYSQFPFPGGNNYAFIWTQSGGLQFLSNYLTSQGANISGFNLGVALAISDDGSTIAGIGSGVGSGSPWYVKLTGGYSAVPPAISVQPPATQRISLCDSIILNVAAVGTAPFTYQWYKNGVPMTNVTTAWGSVITGSTTSQLRITKQRPQDAGNYFCRVTGVGGQTVDSITTVAAVDNTAHPIPGNDTCLTAMDIGESVVSMNICQAWTNDGSASCSANSVGDVWFRYTPSFTGEARIDTCASNYNTAIAIFNTCGGAQVACNETPEAGPPCAFNSSSRFNRYPVTAGVPIFIRVSANGSSTPAGTLNLSVYQAPPRPTNNDCANALDAGIGLNAFDTTEATTDGTASCRSGSSNDTWYRFTPNSPSGLGKLTVSTCGFATINTVINIFASCGGTELACNDNATGVTNCAFGLSQITNLQLHNNNPILIRISGNSSTVFGTGSFNISYTPDPCPADIVDGSSANPFVDPPDGVLTGADFDAFVQAFFQETRRPVDSGPYIADLCNGTGVYGPDGFITGADFDFFIVRFFGGC